MQELRNIAFIDAQNMHMATSQHISNPWVIDLHKLRVYLKEKYQVSEAYYFLGYLDVANQNLYTLIQRAGFILVFREHNPLMTGKKKGNVDTDIVFYLMKFLYENNTLEKYLLLSGDGDYKKVVDYLIEKDKFIKILFPSKQFASSLYKKLGSEYFDYLDSAEIKNKIKK